MRQSLLRLRGRCPLVPRACARDRFAGPKRRDDYPRRRCERRLRNGLRPRNRSALLQVQVFEDSRPAPALRALAGPVRVSSWSFVAVVRPGGHRSASFLMRLRAGRRRCLFRVGFPCSGLVRCSFASSTFGWLLNNASSVGVENKPCRSHLDGRGHVSNLNILWCPD